MKRVRHVGLVALGGALGALARHGLVDEHHTRADHFPWTTLSINLVGAFLLGVILELVARYRPNDTWERFFVGVGLIGAFTTFSTLSVETVLLIRDSHVSTAVAYLLTSLVGGVGAVFVGLLAAGWAPRTEVVPEEGES